MKLRRRGLGNRVKEHQQQDALSPRLVDLKAKTTSSSPQKEESQSPPPTPSSSSTPALSSLNLMEPTRVLFPREKIILGWQSRHHVRGPGSGFVNVGNSCYLNSSLQALLHTPAFVNWIENDAENHRSRCNGTLPDRTPCIICSVYFTLKEQSRGGGAIRPRVLNDLKAICKHFKHGRQEDAHEFFRFLLEGMEKSFLMSIGGLALDNRTKETNPLGQIFGGYVRTEVTCLECHFVSTTFQLSTELQLDIGHSTTLDDALKRHFCTESLDGYKCEKCSTTVEATKRMLIEVPPSVLCLQLKRFPVPLGFGKKISKKITCTRILDMTGFIHQYSDFHGEKDLKYRLVALVTHVGKSPKSGHYNAIVEDCNNNGYYLFDDQNVKQINAHHALNTDAYLMFYEMEEQVSQRCSLDTPVRPVGVEIGREKTILGWDGYEWRQWTESLGLSESSVNRVKNSRTADNDNLQNVTSHEPKRETQPCSSHFQQYLVLTRPASPPPEAIFGTETKLEVFEGPTRKRSCDALETSESDETKIEKDACPPPLLLLWDEADTTSEDEGISQAKRKFIIHSSVSTSSSDCSFGDDEKENRDPELK